MSFADKEYDVASEAIRADRRLRAVRYLLTILAFVCFCFLSYELLHLRGDNARLQRTIQRQTDTALELIDKRISNGIEQNKIQNEETRRYTTCLLLIAIEQRTEAAQRGCYEGADLPGGLEPEDFEPISTGSEADESQLAVAPSQTGGGETVSSPDNTPPKQQEQPNILQPAHPLEPISTLLFDHVTLPLLTIVEWVL